MPSKAPPVHSLDAISASGGIRFRKAAALEPWPKNLEVRERHPQQLRDGGGRHVAAVWDPSGRRRGGGRAPWQQSQWRGGASRPGLLVSLFGCKSPEARRVVRALVMIGGRFFRECVKLISCCPQESEYCVAIVCRRGRFYERVKYRWERLEERFQGPMNCDCFRAVEYGACRNFRQLASDGFRLRTGRIPRAWLDLLRNAAHRRLALRDRQDVGGVGMLKDLARTLNRSSADIEHFGGFILGGCIK